MIIMENQLLGRIVPTVTFVLGMLFMSVIQKDNVKTNIVEKQIVETIVHDTIRDTICDNKVILNKITGTYYNAVEAQCDSDPLVTADNSLINLNKLKDNKIRWIACSRDLLSRWGGPLCYGDTIYVEHENSKVKGKWVVHDSMNKRFKNRIDFLVAEGERFPGVSRNITIYKNTHTEINT